VLLSVNEFQDIPSLRKSNISKRVSASLQNISLRLLSKRRVSKKCDSGWATVNELSSSEGYVTYENYVLNGIRLNGKAHVVQYSANSAKIEFDHLRVEANGESLYIKKAGFLVNDNIFKIEHMYANYESAKEQVEFLNYNQDVVVDEYNNLAIISIDGYIKTACTKGFVYVKTRPEVQIHTDADYLSGALEISAQGAKVTIEFDEDGAYITDVDGVQEYLTYSQIETELNSLGCK